MRRDENSKAVVSNDRLALNKHEQERRTLKRIRLLEMEVAELRAIIQEIQVSINGNND